MQKIVTSFKIHKTVLNKFNLICSAVGKTRSEYILELIEREIEKVNKKCARCEK